MEILSVEGKLFRADRHDNSNNRFFFLILLTPLKMDLQTQDIEARSRFVLLRISGGLV